MEAALAVALTAAAAAQQWAVVSQLGLELEARRRNAVGNVVTLIPASKKR